MTETAITAIILAGGRAQRMGEADKGLQLLRGKPLISWVADSIAPQVEEVLISANRNLARYRELGFAVLPDDMPDFPGPLAGLHSAMKSVRHSLWLSVPCDTPFLPGDLVLRMRAALLGGDAEIAIAASQGVKQPVICLGYTRLYAGLGAFLAGGGRRVGGWQAGLRCEMVSFDDPEMFDNINTPAELERAGMP